MENETKIDNTERLKNRAIRIEANQLARVKNDGCSICWFDGPISDEVKLAAVTQTWEALGYIEDKGGATDEMRFIAIKQEPLAIRQIENPSPEIQFEAIKRDYDVITYIDNPAAGIEEYAKKIKKIEESIPRDVWNARRGAELV